MESDLTRVTLDNGIELDVWDVGPRDAPALVFLHGFPENHRTWRHQVAHLSDRYRCIAPDQRGYGNSSRPEGAEHYEAGAIAGDIAGLAAKLELGSYTVVGHDWGGAIAWLMAAHGQANGHVERLIIANSPHPMVFARLLFENADQRAASQYFNTFRDTSNDALVREHGLAALLAKVFDFSDRKPNDPAQTALMLEQWSDPDRAIAMLNWYRASPLIVPPMDAPMGVPAGINAPAFPKLTIPTLVMWGLDDVALVPANLDGLDAWIEDLTLVPVEGAGHFLPWEAPDAVNAAMDEFLLATQK